MINDRHDPIIAAYLNDFKGTDGILSDEKQRELAISMNKEVVMARAYKSSLKDKTISVNTKRRLNSQLYELLETIEPQRRKLTETNLPFVVSTAKRYTNQGLSFLDLIQVGSEAMYEKATIQYDPFHELNSKFVSYAAWWVRQGMIRAIGDQSTTIRIPVHKRDTINKIKIFSNRFFSKHGRLPHSDEISKSIGIPADKVEFALENSQEISSLDAPVHETNGKNLSDITSYENDSVEEQRLKYKSDLAHIINNTNLTIKERAIIDSRFGLNSGISRTLEYVGKELGLTRERIRQIENKARKKLNRTTNRLGIKLEDIL